MDVMITSRDLSPTTAGGEVHRSEMSSSAQQNWAQAARFGISVCSMYGLCASCSVHIQPLEESPLSHQQPVLSPGPSFGPFCKQEHSKCALCSLRANQPKCFEGLHASVQEEKGFLNCCCLFPEVHQLMLCNLLGCLPTSQLLAVVL